MSAGGEPSDGGRARSEGDHARGDGDHAQGDTRQARSARRRLTISRESQESGFVYRQGARKITSRKEIERIEALAIPPAWSEVEISRSASAKVLARGVDAAGRVQTIYHPSFRRRQDRRKFDRVQRFGRALPKLRARVDRDLRRRGLGRDRVVACVIRLIDLQLFRIGGTRYAQQHRSYGVTTLREKHLSLASGSEIVEFDFVGKSGKRQQRRLRDARVARLLSQLLAVPGHEVFRFFDEDDVVHRVRSRHVNAYVKRHMGKDFTAKDFRTWGGTVLVAAALLESGETKASTDETEASTDETEPSPDEAEASTNEAQSQKAKTRERSTALRSAIEVASEKLGNTPAVTRSSYVDPRVLEAVDNPELLERVRRVRLRPARYLSADEQRTLKILEWSVK